MKKVNAQDVFAEALSYVSGDAEGGKDLDKGEKLFNQILNHNLGNPTVLYAIGTIAMERGHHGLAVQLLSYVTGLQPEFGEAWNNLALCFRALNDLPNARKCFTQASIQLTDNPDVLSNLAATYITSGDPDKCLEYAEQALAINPDHLKGTWHKALALLEKQDFRRGWHPHEIRLTPGAASEDVATRNYHGDKQTQRWDGNSPQFVVVHGEQGLGDEVMFASCIADALKTGAKLLLEPSPRLHGLFKRSFPDCLVYGTNNVHGEDWIEKEGIPDRKIALGSLPKFWRREEKDFPGTPYLVADPILRKKYREKLNALGPRAKIGIAWQGGVQSTRVDLRSIFLTDMVPILEATDADFISLQYTDLAEENVAELKEKTGHIVHHWPEAAQAIDLDETAALITELDLVISVCQTAIHLAGALGTPTWCLVPSAPSWRYGVVGNMPWYESVDLFRNEEDDWTDLISDVADGLREATENLKVAV